MTARRHVWASALAAVVAVLATGCGGESSGIAHTPFVELARGDIHGVGWHLLGWDEHGQLCLMVLPRQDNDPDDPTAAPSWPTDGGGGCGFNQNNPSTSYWASAVGPAGSGFDFGPLPSDATRIQVSTREILASSPLPTGRGLPRGRYWIHVMPAGWPTAADGAGLSRPRPLDEHGEPVAFQAF